jgi:hypothetical protein
VENGPGTGRSPYPRVTPHRRGRRRRALGRAVLLVAGAIVVAAVLGSRGGAAPAQRLALSYARSWAGRDWRALYGDLDASSRTALPLASFTAIVRGDADLATTLSARVGTASPVGSQRYAVALTVRTRIFGTLRERLLVTMTGPVSAPRVHFDASASFPGLRAGERLRRVDRAPRRGTLLARDGTPLEDLPAAANVVGAVGTASGTQLEQTIAAGFPADTLVGLDGLELVFQRALGGQPGGSLYAGRRLLAVAATQPGVDVRTSISAPLQTLAVAELGTSLGGIVVMEPDTGEILAAAGAPLSELQPPGSTFKIVTVTGVLEAGLGNARTVYPYATSATLDGFVLHNANGEDCGGTLANAFAVSCNSVFAPLGARLGARALLGAATAYGFNAPSPIPIAAESTIPPSSLTDDLQLGESAIGQAQVEASPLQMARVAATIALVGRRPVPTFGLVGHRPLFPRVIPVGVARTVRALMRDVVSYGTGTSAQIPGVVVAGKTGTAEVVTLPACRAKGASGATGATRVATRSARATAGKPVATAAQAGTGGAPAPPATGTTTGGGSAAGGAAAPSPSSTGGAGASGGGTLSGSSPVSTGAGGSAASGAPTGGQAGSGGSARTGTATGATGPTGCSGRDTNPYDTDAWFVAFAPEIHPRFVVSVLLPHDGAGGTTAAPLARAILEQALSGDA